MKVFITQKLPGNCESLLMKKGIVTETYKSDDIISKSYLIKKIKNVDALICLLTNKIDKEVIDNMSSCKVISNVAVGFNNIDIEYAKLKKIVVTNTPGILTDTTADLAVSLILACARRIAESDQFMRARKFKKWMPQLMLGLDLKGKTVGIIGAGRIGQEVAARLKSFKTKIIYSSITRKLDFEKNLGSIKVSLNYLMRNSDYITVHVPFNKSTFHLLNKQNLTLMKKDAVIVNTSRGEVIEETALIELLKNKKIFAAGLDVYENEPNINPELLKLKNIILLPHIGSATIETRSKMSFLAAKNVISVLKNGKAINPVN
ncbi:MAG: D-glycerate dehydrogenase [Ignavibacteria bacterium]|nr:D-glycerate dehydrogenase [Ignavibacteria bacterium]